MDWRSAVIDAATSAKLRVAGGVIALTKTWTMAPAAVGIIALFQICVSGSKNMTLSEIAGVVTSAATAPCHVERFQKRPNRMITANPLIVTGRNFTTKLTMAPA